MHQKCYNEIEELGNKWWAGMYSYNLACAKHNLNVKEERICAIPGRDTKIQEHTCCIHYSIPYLDFDKKKYHLCTYEEKNTILSKSTFNSLDDVGMIFFAILKDWIHSESGGRSAAPG